MLYQRTRERVLDHDLSIGQLCRTDMHCVLCRFTRATDVPGDLPRTPVALGFGRVISRDLGGASADSKHHPESTPERRWARGRAFTKVPKSRAITHGLWHGTRCGVTSA